MRLLILILILTLFSNCSLNHIADYSSSLNISDSSGLSHNSLDSLISSSSQLASSASNPSLLSTNVIKPTFNLNQDVFKISSSSEIHKDSLIFIEMVSIPSTLSSYSVVSSSSSYFTEQYLIMIWNRHDCPNNSGLCKLDYKEVDSSGYYSELLKNSAEMLLKPGYYLRCSGMDGKTKWKEVNSELLPTGNWYDYVVPDSLLKNPYLKQTYLKPSYCRLQIKGQPAEPQALYGSMIMNYE